jgi:group II intron reverse transcriptase/maturase
VNMPTWTDKVVQEVLRMLLEAYYEPQFSEHSHGFRPGRGCHTALEEIQGNWTGTVWFIEGDIKGCFENIDHERLITILREQIKDEHLLALIRSLLKAGYLEEWTYHVTHSGTPQGGIISPLLANIYMHALDKFVDQILLPEHTRGTGKRYNPEYDRLNLKQQRGFKTGKIAEAKMYRKQMQQLPSLDPTDPNFRRLRYVRYADDFLLGYIGTREEAEGIKTELESFLKTIGLTLSVEKTLITHARTEKARFLGYNIQTLKQDRIQGIPKGPRNPQKRHRRRINGRIGLTIPNEILKEKENRYGKQGKGVARGILTTELAENDIQRYLTATGTRLPTITELMELSEGTRRQICLRPPERMLTEGLVSDLGARHTRRLLWQPTSQSILWGGTAYADQDQIPQPTSPNALIALRVVFL